MDAGRQLAAEKAWAMFHSADVLAEGLEYYGDVKGRMAGLGRDPSPMSILLAAFVVVGTDAQPGERRALVDSLVHSASAIGWRSVQLGTDGSEFDLDAPLPPIPENNVRRIGRHALVDPAAIAVGMRGCFEAGAYDGFTMMFPYLSADVDSCVEGVLPEMQPRGLVRWGYAGRDCGTILDYRASITSSSRRRNKLRIARRHGLGMLSFFVCSCYLNA